MGENLQILKRWGKRALPWGLLILALWLIIQDVQERALVPTGSPAPELSLSLSDGSQFALGAQDGIVVLNFWATWCPPCRAEAPELTRAHNQLRSDGGPGVIGLSTDTAELAAVSAKARDFGMMYPVGIAGPDVLANFQVTSLPTTYVIAADGTISRSFVGPVTESQVLDAVASAASD